ncbi:hypothetical protein BLA29_010466, partial [Euroglyphus maynei]
MLSYDTFVNTGLKNVKTIACGLSHCLALTHNNELYSWGDKTKGQLGQSIKDSIQREPFIVPFSDNLIRSKIKSIAAGAWHSLVLLDNGEILVSDLKSLQKPLHGFYKPSVFGDILLMMDRFIIVG